MLKCLRLDLLANLPTEMTSKVEHNSFVPTSKTHLPPPHTIGYNSCTAAVKQRCLWLIYITLKRTMLCEEQVKFTAGKTQEIFSSQAPESSFHESTKVDTPHWQNTQVWKYVGLLQYSIHWLIVWYMDMVNSIIFWPQYCHFIDAKWHDGLLPLELGFHTRHHR